MAMQILPETAVEPEPPRNLSIGLWRSGDARRPNRLMARTLLLSLAAASFVAFNAPARAQSVSAQKLVQQVIDNELYYNRTDHSHWMFLDSDKTPSKDTLKLVVQTPEASVSRLLELNGRALTPQQQAQDRSKMESVVNDPNVRAKQKKSSAHDDAQAVSMMKILPNAFLWTYAGESSGEITLNFKPNPAFQPPTYASRVFAAMAGSMVIDAKQKRIKVLQGTLIQNVEFGWGLLGKLEKGGTFHVVHSEIEPGDWEITQTNIHIQGHMLLFKSISEQEDEITSHYKRTPASMTLREAADSLASGSIAKDLDVDR